MRVLVTVLLMCLWGECLAISLPSILSSLTRRADESAADQETEDSSGESKDPPHHPHHTTHRPTRPPLVPAIPHPADTPLNPYTNPHHPLHPDNLPHLPHLPHLPNPFHRETIHATKTVFVELTERVTIHPVCMTAIKLTPPCLPFDPHHPHYHSPHHPHPHKGEGKGQDVEEKPYIKPSAVIELEPTRILDKITSSDFSPVEFEEAAATVEASAPVEEAPQDSERSGRYVELTPSIPATERVEIKDAPVEHEHTTVHTSPLDVVHNLLHHSPVTIYKTKTLWVTKVEKVLDTRVTATLIAENCVPTNSHIPVCAPHGGLVSPGYHGYLGYGYHGDGIYTENYGGHLVAGLHTDKRPGYSPENGVYEHTDKEEAKEEPDQEAKEEKLEEIELED